MDAPVDALEEPARDWRWGHFALLLAVAVCWLVLSALNLWMGELNQDEGWYLYAAKRITEGRLPYRDFAFTQPPLLPVVYSWAFNWVGRFGLLGGRVLTWLFGALGMLSSIWLAMRSGPRSAQRLTGGLACILIAMNVYQSYFTTVVKTYALAGFCLSLGLTMLSFVGKHKGFRAAVAAGFLLACAAATRITLGAALALGGFYLLFCRRRLRAWAWVDYGLGGLLGLGLTLLPFMAMGRDGFRFGILEYHSLRESGSVLVQLAYKTGCLSRLVQAYFPAAVGFFAVLILAFRFLARRGQPPDGAETTAAGAPPEDVGPRFNAFLWVVAGAVGLIHLAAPFPYDDYQVPVYPVFCAALSATLAHWWVREEVRRYAGSTAAGRSARRLAILTVIWLMCGLHAFSSPLAQSWFVAGRDRIWWRLRTQSPVAQLRDMAQWIRDLSDAAQGKELLTQDTYLAVEAGLPVPRGLEMGPFSYYPDWPRERAEKIGVLNRDMMLDLLATESNAPIAAFSGYSLSIRSPEVEEVVREDRLAFDEILQTRFELVESVPGFGQAGTTLDIWRLKQEPAPWTPPPETPEE